MPYGKLITRFTTGGHDIFITCPAKSMHLEPFGLSVHAFCRTGDENIIPTCRSAGNYYITHRLSKMYDYVHWHCQCIEIVKLMGLLYFSMRIDSMQSQDYMYIKSDSR